MLNCEFKDGHVFFMVRFSILSRKAKHFYNIAREVSYEDYKNSLFSRARLNQHLFMFENFTLPSIESAERCKDAGYSIMVFTSTHLPNYIRERLELLRDRYPILIFDLDEDDTVSDRFEEFIFKLPYNLRYVTARIDDDDLVADGYLEALSWYNDERFVGFGISFGSGFEARYCEVQRKFTEFTIMYYPKIAIGLAFVNFWDAEARRFKSPYSDIFRLGKHTRIDVKIPTIVDSSFPAYIRTSHSKSDTEGRGFIKRKQKAVSVTLEDVAEYFSILRNTNGH